MNKTPIEWSGLTWGPTGGCSFAGPDCTGCYALGMAHRFQASWGKGLTKTNKAGKVQWTGKLVVRDDGKITEPIRLRGRHSIFVNSTSDLFHENLEDTEIDPIVTVMLLCPQHRFMTLTKRGHRMAEYFANKTLYERVLRCAEKLRARWPRLGQVGISNPSELLPTWTWWGISAGYQGGFDERHGGLHKMPRHSIQFLSIEPLIGPMSIRQALWRKDIGPNAPSNVRWVICGAESGPKRRPAKVEWVRQIRDECVTANVQFFFKQWAACERYDDAGVEAVTAEYSFNDTKSEILSLPLLDGVQWKQDPSMALGTV